MTNTSVKMHHYVDAKGVYVGSFDSRAYADQSWIEVEDHPPHGLATLSDGVWDMSAPVRIERDAILATEVDPIAGNALRWAALTAEQQQAWADYRQALLDIPQQSGFPHDVVWPSKP